MGILGSFSPQSELLFLPRMLHRVPEEEDALGIPADGMGRFICRSGPIDETPHLDQIVSDYPVPWDQPNHEGVLNLIIESNSVYSVSLLCISLLGSQWNVQFHPKFSHERVFLLKWVDDNFFTAVNCGSFWFHVESWDVDPTNPQVGSGKTPKKKNDQISKFGNPRIS